MFKVFANAGFRYFENLYGRLGRVMAPLGPICSQGVPQQSPQKSSRSCPKINPKLDPQINKIMQLFNHFGVSNRAPKRPRTAVLAHGQISTGLSTKLLALRWPRMVLRQPEITPKLPKMAPRWTQDGSRRPQDGPIWSQDVPKCPKDASRWF